MSAIDLLARDPLAAAVGWGILHSLWQVSLIALGCAAALRFARRAGPDIRYAISFVGLALMLVWPAATAVEYSGYRDAPGPETRWRQRAEGPSVPRPALPDSAAANLSTFVSPRVPAPRAPFGSPLSLRLNAVLPYVSLLWAAGVLLFATRTLGGWYVAQRLRRRFVAPPPDQWEIRFSRLVRRLKITARVALLESALVEVPTVVGWIKPVVLVPASAFAGLSPQQLDAILAHELAHVRRHDYLANLLQALVETLLFYHPAMWWLSSHARSEREHCCDDLAVSLCGNRVAYARALADLETVRRDAPALALGADGGSLLRRVARLLGAPASHERTPAWMIAGAVAATALAFALGGGDVRAEHPGSDAADSGTTVIEQSPAPVAPRPPQAPRPPAPAGAGATAPAAPAAPSAPAAPASGSRLTIDGEGRISHSAASGKWDVRYRGQIELSDDDRDVRRIAPGGYFKVSEGGWLSSRRVELTATAAGLERKFYRGLREEPFDADAQQFLARMIQKLVRSGFAAPQRVSRLLARGGANAVLREIETLDSDDARKAYYIQLLTQATLDAPTLARALASAGRQITSDYESAELLIAAARQALSNPDARRTFFQTASAIASDYEQRRVLGAALETGLLDRAGLLDLVQAARGIESDYEHRRLLFSVAQHPGLDREVRRMLLHSSASIGSDYEQAEFLMQWLKSGGVEDLPGEFFDGVSTLGSGHEQGRVLAAVLDEPGLSAAQLIAALRATASVNGDHERSQLLQRAARRHAITGDVRAAYLAAADRLRGSDERDQAYAALVRAERR